MLLTQSALNEKSADLAAGIAAARSARNLMTRRRREDAADEFEAERHRRRRKRKDERELEQLLRRRARVFVPFDERPRTGVTTARKLYHRTVGTLRGTTGITDARGSDGLYSLHFGFVARGFASTTGRRWRAGEAERAARYIVREDGLEGGELGWWSNIAADRTELVAFFRAAEAVERHDRTNANVYVSEIIALPAELSGRQRRRAVKRICRFYEKRGLAYVAAIHTPDEAGDQRNFHCHIIYSLRPAERHGAYDWSFGLAKENEINTPAGIAARRRQVVRDINATLHAAGIDKRYTHLSNKARRMAAAQAKVGQNGIWVSRRLAALEARAARLRQIAGITGHVRETLTKSNGALAQMKAAIEDRLAGKRRELEASTKLAKAQGAALRTIVIDQLQRRRSSMTSGTTDAQNELRRCAAQITMTLEQRWRDIVETQRFTDARLPAMAAAIQERVGDRRAAIDAAQRERARLIDRAGTDLRHALEAQRSAVTAQLSNACASLDCATKRMEFSQKRHAFDAIRANVALHQDALSSARTVLVERLTTMRASVIRWTIGIHPLSACVTEARDALVRDLTACKGKIVSTNEAAAKALADAAAAGRRLASRGIGRGPGAIAQSGGAAASELANAHSVSRPGARLTSPGTGGAVPPGRQTVTPNPAPQCESEAGREPVRQVADLTPAPPPPPPPPVAETQAPLSTESLREQSQIDLLRGQAQARQDGARRKLRDAAIARLRLLDIAIVTDAAGRFAVMKGALADDEMRALMDPAFDKGTQDMLARIASARAQQAAAQAATVTSHATAPPQRNAASSQTASTSNEDFEWLKRLRAHQQGGGGIGDT